MQLSSIVVFSVSLLLGMTPRGTMRMHFLISTMEFSSCNRNIVVVGALHILIVTGCTLSRWLVVRERLWQAGAGKVKNVRNGK
jgi:hypothetical protein